jgi:hypothetical protein
MLSGFLALALPLALTDGKDDLYGLGATSVLLLLGSFGLPLIPSGVEE